MSFESTKTSLPDNIIPVDNNINSNWTDGFSIFCKLVMIGLPFTRGAKLGLLKALKSNEDVLETLLPRKRV